MPKITDARDLLVHQLAVVDATEKAVAAALPKLVEEANNEELRSVLEQHLEETRGQIRVLEQAFELLGEKQRPAKALAFEGLDLQHRGFAIEAADDVQPDVLDTVALASTAATEHLEIATYESLITLAETLGASQVAGLLQQNLEQEQRMLGQVQGLARRLAAAEQAAGDGDRSLADDLARGVRETGSPVEQPRRVET